MEQFQHLIKARTRALGLFNKVINKLQRVEAKVSKEISEAKHEIEQAQDLIGAMEDNIEFLDKELKVTQNHRTAIQGLINVKHPDEKEETGQSS